MSKDGGAFCSELSDETIAAEIIAGRQELFRLLVERHERRVIGLGLGFFRNEDEAADFAQDVFLKAASALPQFEGRSRFSTWLYRIAYTSAINRVNRRKEYRSLSENDCESAYGTPEEEHIKALAREAVRQAVAELPEKYRICVDLFFFYERSYEEIKVITGHPVNTIKSHVFRAKKILREKLKSFVEGGVP
ncbi:MAG: sigma-70 family RNA polymerase sigma factor [Spirochaetaceae bacterium]|nr:sigma-70 family RNA polymerase sigma factor [Spirochaetaceae bacterium]